MRNDKHLPKRLWLAIPAAALALLMVITGCSTSPTQSESNSSEHRDLWNPAPGTELEPGQEVPLLNEDYWEILFGPNVNPRRVLLSEIEYIGEDGGTVALGYHNYVIPDGALEEGGNFTLAIASYSGVGVDCGPSPYYFDEPVLLTLSYRGTQYERNESDALNLHIYYVADDGTMERLESSVDTETKCVRAYVDHFSRYILG